MYGDSYILRLKEFCKKDLRVPADVLWHEKSGLRSDFINRQGKIDDSAVKNYESLKELQPDVVFMNVGGNDLTTTSDPNNVYEQIMALVDDLKGVGVKDVYVAEIMPRGDFSMNPDPKMNQTSFERQRRKINYLLAKTVKTRCVKFADVLFPDEYSTDEVHLANSGLKKYESRLRRIFCSLKAM